MVFVVVMTVIVGGMLMLALRSPLAKALARRIAGEPREGELMSEEVMARLDQVQVMEDRLLELEERVEFAERLLAGDRPQHLAAPGDR
jgi:hypothetical protein